MKLKMRSLSRDKHFFGLEIGKKTEETVMHVTHEIINIQNVFHYIFERRLGVVGLSIKTPPQNYGETLTAKWVLFHPFFDVY